MKKVLVVSNMYPSKKYPHYGVFVRNSVEILENEGNCVDTVYIKKTDGMLGKIINYCLFYIKTIFKILFKNYDVVYAHYASHTALPILLATVFKAVFLIVNVHGNDIIPETKSDEKYKGIVTKLLNKSDIVICPSTYFSQSVHEMYHVEVDKIIVYPSGGVDTTKFTKIPRKDALTKLGLSENKRYIGYVSRIEENKGWDIFLYAVKQIVEQLEDVEIIIVGDGSQILDYRKLVGEYNIEAYIHKYDLLAQDDIVNVYNALDVFVFPTYRKSESLGLVGLEAMSCGTVTVLPNMYGPSSYAIDGENSIVFESANRDSLCGAVKKALTLNENERNKIENAAVKTASMYDREKTKGILTSIFRGLDSK